MESGGGIRPEIATGIVPGRGTPANKKEARATADTTLPMPAYRIRPALTMPFQSCGNPPAGTDSGTTPGKGTPADRKPGSCRVSGSYE